MHGGPSGVDCSTTACQTIEKKVSELQRDHGTALVYSFSVTKSSKQGDRTHQCSTSDKDNEAALNDAVAAFPPANHKTLFRRMLEGDETVAEPFWTCFYSLPFTLRAMLAVENPHSATRRLSYVKAGRALGSPIASFRGTAKEFRIFLESRLTTANMLFLGGVNTCAALKRSGRTPPRGVQPSPKRTRRVVRNVLGTAYQHRQDRRLFGLRSNDEGRGLGVKFLGSTCSVLFVCVEFVVSITHTMRTPLIRSIVHKRA